VTKKHMRVHVLGVLVATSCVKCSSCYIHCICRSQWPAYYMTPSADWSKKRNVLWRWHIFIRISCTYHNRWI